jgi:hypothetical protein
MKNRRKHLVCHVFKILIVIKVTFGIEQNHEMLRISLSIDSPGSKTQEICQQEVAKESFYINNVLRTQSCHS